MVCFASLVHVSRDLSGRCCQSQALAGACAAKRRPSQVGSESASCFVPSGRRAFHHLLEGTEDVHSVCGAMFHIKRDLSLQNGCVSQSLVPSFGREGSFKVSAGGRSRGGVLYGVLIELQHLKISKISH